MSQNKTGYKVKYAILIAKLTISIGGICFVAIKFDFQQSVEQLESLSFGWMCIILSLFIAQLFVASIRYREFLALMGERLSINKSIDACLVGYFFSQTFLSFVGGDAMRVLRTASFGISAVNTTKAVILDRSSGFVGLLTLMILVFPFLLPKLPDMRMQGSLVGLMAVLAVFVGGVVVFLTKLPSAVKRVNVLADVADHLDQVLRGLWTPRGMGVFLGLSLVVSLINCLLFFSIIQGIGLSVSLWYCLILLPPVFFVSMLPISVAGWGVREGAAIFALGLVGVSSSNSLAVSVCYGLGLVIVSLPGGLLWLLSRNPIRNRSKQIDG
jgi:uncharacterized membrane protein YbhN (UPF0104 family)